MEEYDVVILGESLIDFLPLEEGKLGRFKATPGGAPTNVAYGLAKLGNKVALISRIGNEPLGKSIIHTLKEGGVETKFIQIDKEKPTTVTIVMPKSEDMQRYVIYRNNTADGSVSFDEIPDNIFKGTKIFHCGTLAMSSPIANRTTQLAIKSAKEHGAIISVDVNLRPSSWGSQQEMIKASLQLIEQSDVVKMTKEESLILNINPKEAVKGNNKIILVTDGGEGAKVYYKDDCITCKAPSVKVVDETGAGDSFTSSFLHFYLLHVHTMETKELLTKGLQFAVYAGSEAVQRHGAIVDF